MDELIGALPFIFFIVVFLIIPAMTRRSRAAELERRFAAIQRKRKSRVIAIVHRQEPMGLLGIPQLRYIDLNDAEDVLEAYRTKINGHDFDQLVPLISEAAIFWFNDGSREGIAAIRQAFEATWRSFPHERYWLEDQRWIAQGDVAASCVYHFRWEAVVEGTPRSGGGRGTTVLALEGEAWKIVHEHTSVPFHMDGSFRAATDLQP